MSELELPGVETEEVDEDVTALEVPEGGVAVLIIAHVGGEHYEFHRSFPTLLEGSTGLEDMAGALANLAVASDEEIAESDLHVNEDEDEFPDEAPEPPTKQVRIIFDGTENGMAVYVHDKRLDFVTDVLLTARPGQLPEASITVIGPYVDATAELQVERRESDDREDEGLFDVGDGD